MLVHGTSSHFVRSTRATLSIPTALLMTASVMATEVEAPARPPPPVLHADPLAIASTTGSQLDAPTAFSYPLSSSVHALVVPGVGEDDFLIEPVLVSDAVVSGPVSAELAAELEAVEAELGRAASASSGATRGLLHGGHGRPGRFPDCPRCLTVRCDSRNGIRTCSGHCRLRTNQRPRPLQLCNDNNVAGPAGPDPVPDAVAEPMPSCSADDDMDNAVAAADLEQSPPSSIAEYDTVVVTAEAPYIGCADIANRPSGCPARGTRAMLPGGRQVSVLTSVCRTEPYVPDCGSPLLPFGVCECFYRDVPIAIPGVRGPPLQTVRTVCSTTELAAGSGVGGADGSPSEDGLVVQPAGDRTLTWFSDFIGPESVPRFSYDVTATARSIDVEVSLDIYSAVIFIADDVRDVPLPGSPEDYDYSEEQSL